MKKTISSIVIAGTVCTLALFAYLNTDSTPSTRLFMTDYSDKYETEFANFISNYGRSFGTRAEFNKRKSLFIEKLKELESFNEEGHTSTVGIN